MLRGLKLAHIGGLVVFLGSILTFILVSALIEGASLQNIAFGRDIISAGTRVLTLPAMWALAISGVWMGYNRYGLKQQFFRVKLLVVALVVINAHLFVVPAVASTTELAARSLAQGHLLAEYKAAYVRESVFGALNVLLTITAAVIGVWRVNCAESMLKEGCTSVGKPEPKHRR